MRPQGKYYWIIGSYPLKVGHLIRVPLPLGSGELLAFLPAD
jgi:hypothetical protein